MARRQGELAGCSEESVDCGRNVGKEERGRRPYGCACFLAAHALSGWALLRLHISPTLAPCHDDRPASALRAAIAALVNTVRTTP